MEGAMGARVTRMRDFLKKWFFLGSREGAKARRKIFFEEWVFYPQITQMDTDKGTSAGWNLCESVESVDDNGLWFVGCGLVFGRVGFGNH